jgi:hypothetical protein
MIVLTYLIGGVFLGFVAAKLLVLGFIAVGLATCPAALGGAIAWVVITRLLCHRSVDAV